jgi:hypothetical protein
MSTAEQGADPTHRQARRALIELFPQVIAVPKSGALIGRLFQSKFGRPMIAGCRCAGLTSRGGEVGPRHSNLT